MAESILVIGGGTMGKGIAQVAAGAGYNVEIVEPLEALRADSLDGVRWRSDVPERSEAMLAIEAVPERFDLKREIFIALGRALRPDALLATNTSSLSVGELADVVPKPERVLGMHFFNPPQKMQLVEIVHSEETSDDALDRAAAIVERFGKTAVFVADTPGFIVNRVARPYYLQSLRALSRGVGSVEELDALARSAGFRMGPFELMDLIGLDVNFATSESIYARTQADRFAPVELQRRTVAQGLLGRKSGAGFYVYAEGKPRRFDPAPAPPNPEPNAHEMVAVIGFGARADEWMEALEPRYERVQQIENDELVGELPGDVTIAIDAGNGFSDRSDVIVELDSMLGPESVLFYDAYATDLAPVVSRLRNPERVVGYGVLGPLARQAAVEVVDSELASDDALELAQELFSEIGKGAILVEDLPGLFLGRTIGSIVNEAMIVVHEGVATPEDVDTAMRLGANYPLGPIEWGREIGGARLARILKRLAEAEGEAFAPHRSLWVLDVEEAETGPEMSESQS